MRKHQPCYIIINSLILDKYHVCLVLECCKVNKAIDLYDTKNKNNVVFKALAWLKYVLQSF